MRGGKTVEVVNTDAEGRMVMGDALVLATEEPVDAIVDIATLTGAALKTLGTDIAAVLGNDASLIDRVKASAERVDEPVWELPLARRYRGQLNSTLADLRNLGARMRAPSPRPSSSRSSWTAGRGPTSTSRARRSCGHPTGGATRAPPASAPVCSSTWRSTSRPERLMVSGADALPDIRSSRPAARATRTASLRLPTASLR
ncbi:hypothetical protein G7085_11335 [Tessaracoccus sp. HDW20]|nr:hypothetical protein [Tessaracoccus coleopterorum]NHB85006.1 hypothetical protein [Tessaracoccus coleopterorum]